MIDLRRHLPRDSLTARLLWPLVGSLAALAVLLGAGGALFIEQIAEQTSDRVLGASARAIAETLAVEDGNVTLDLPPSALGMLENNARDNVYYSIRHNDELLTGYADLPKPSTKGLEDEETHFRYGRYRGAQIRIATEVRRLPRVEGLVTVEVAETLEARHALARRMLTGLVTLEAVFVVMTALLVWPALQWSLRPITRLRTEMDVQPVGGGHFTPLKTDAVPVELVGLVNGFNALLQRLDEAVDGIRRFTADASHQMRTPLAVLRTHLTLLRRHVKPEGRESLQDVEEATDRLQRLLTRLVILARAEEEPVRGERPARSDLREITARVVADLDQEAHLNTVQVTVSASGACFSATDPILTAEILANLLDNAIRYNRPGGHVDLILDQKDDCVQLIVDDNGPGIPAEHLDQVFQRFFRLSRDADKKGSGLGLSIVAALARNIGAEIALPSKTSQGLKVVLKLPITWGVRRRSFGRLSPSQAAAPPIRRRLTGLKE